MHIRKGKSQQVRFTNTAFIQTVNYLLTVCIIIIIYTLPDDGSNAILFQNQILSFHPFSSLSLISLTGRRYTHLQQRAVQTTSHTRVHENLADSQRAGGVSVFVPLHVFTFCGRGRDVGGAQSFSP